MSTFYVYLAITLQACLLQNAFGRLLNSGVGRNGYGLEVDAKAVSRGPAGLTNYGLDNVGLTNTRGRGLSLNNIGSKSIGLNNVGTKSIGLNSFGAREIGLNNLCTRGIGLNNLGVTGVSRNSIGLNGLSVGNRGTSGELNNAASFGGSKYGVGVPDVIVAESIVPVTGPFVSIGEADVAVGGEFVASGSTLVARQIPVLGSVGYSGTIPARGVVSIAGECSCSRIPL